jgi:hypothetical protein
MAGTTSRVHALEVGVAGATFQGEPASGDVHVVQPREDGVLIAVVDGLGHGGEAREAAQRAAAELRAPSGGSMIALVRRCHAVLTGTRGVVMSVDETMTWLGVGNVAGVLVRADPASFPRREGLVVRGGIIGAQLPLLHAAVTSIKAGDMLVFATDGIRVAFFERIEPAMPPQQLAERILAEYGKGTDDALVVTARYRGTTSGPGA